MKSVKIGGTSWTASNVALGIMRMGTLSVADSARALDAAYAAGINFFDSADIYGNDPVLGRGSSEIHFGQALKQSGLARSDFYFQSKGGCTPMTITRLPATTPHART